MTAHTIAPQSTWTHARRKSDGREFYFIPSTESSDVYMASTEACTCPSARYSKDGSCKHSKAVKATTSHEAQRPQRERMRLLLAND